MLREPETRLRPLGVMSHWIDGKSQHRAQAEFLGGVFGMKKSLQSIY